MMISVWTFLFQEKSSPLLPKRESFSFFWLEKNENYKLKVLVCICGDCTQVMTRKILKFMAAKMRSIGFQKIDLFETFLVVQR